MVQHFVRRTVLRARTHTHTHTDAMDYGYICDCFELAFLGAYLDHDFNIFRYPGEVFATNQPTPWKRVLLQKLKGFQVFKKFHACYETQKFFTASLDPATCRNPEPH